MSANDKGISTGNTAPWLGCSTGYGVRTKPWGGVTGADALVISRHTIGTVPLVGLRLKAGDVNNNNTVNTQDALLVSRRFSGISSSFTAGTCSDIDRQSLKSPVTCRKA